MGLSEAWVDFIAGWASGAAGVVAVQPIDTVLTRRQAGLASQGAAVTSRSLVNNHGLLSLWRGSFSMMSTVPLQNAILMGGYGVGQKYAEMTSSSNPLLPIFIGGFSGGILQSFLMSPVELIKISQQCNMQTSALTAGTKVAVEMVQSSTIWRGLTATLLRDGLPHGVWFASYEVTKNTLEQLMGKDTVLVPLVSGANAATVAWLVGYPADVIKTKQQAGSSLGVLALGRQLVREANGNVIQGLYQGFGLKLFRAVPASMIGFSVYEAVKKQLT